MAYTQAVLNLSPLAYWKLNEKWEPEQTLPVEAQDSSGNENHASYIDFGYLIDYEERSPFGDFSLRPHPDPEDSCLRGPLLIEQGVYL